MKNSEKKGYILAGVPFIIVNLMILSLINSKYLMAKGQFLSLVVVLIIAWIVFFLSFPFMKRIANIKVISDNTGRFIVIFLVLIFFLLFLFEKLVNFPENISISTFIVILIFGWAIFNILKEYVKFLKKKINSKKKDEKE